MVHLTSLGQMLNVGAAIYRLAMQHPNCKQIFRTLVSAPHALEMDTVMDPIPSNFKRMLKHDRVPELQLGPQEERGYTYEYQLFSRE